MKKIALLALAFGVFAAPLNAVAQVVAASPAAAPDVCPCTDYRFTPKTDKAKAVADFWETRSRLHIASGLGSMVLLFSAMTHQPTNALGDAERSVGQAQDDLLRARDRAVKLGGLKVLGDGGADSPVLVTLKKGVDYDLKDPR